MELSDKLKAAILGITGVVTIAGAKYNAQEIVQKYENGEIDDKEIEVLLEENQLDMVDDLNDITDELKKINEDDEKVEQASAESGGEPPNDYKSLEDLLDELGIVIDEEENEGENEEDNDFDGEEEEDEFDLDEDEEDDDLDEERAEDDEDKDDFGDQDDAMKEKEAQREKERQEKIEQREKNKQEKAEQQEKNRQEKTEHQEKNKQETAGVKEKIAEERTDAMKKGAQERIGAMEKEKDTDIKDDFGDEDDVDGLENSVDSKTDNADRAESREKFQNAYDQKAVNSMKESDPEQYERIMSANRMAVREEIDEAAGGETCWDNMSSKEMWDMYDKNPERAKMLMQDYQDRHPYGDSDFESPNTKEIIETNRAESKKQRDNNDGIPEDMLESENPYQEFVKTEEIDSQRL